MHGAIQTLLLPFASGDLAPPEGRWAFFGAQAEAGLKTVFARADLLCEQPMRPDFRTLEQAGFAAVPHIDDAPEGRFDGVLVLLGRHRRVNEARIARAARLARPGAPVLVAGDKKLGAASARKWAAGRVTLMGALSKHHAQAFWFGAHAAAFADVALARTEPAPGLHAAPGMFSCDRVDPGSALLAQCIDARVNGAVADFGAGWGYLSFRLLQQGRPTALTLVEAHKPSLDQALANVAPWAGTIPVTGCWLDIGTEPVPGRFDWVVMNPPFHAGRQGDPELGQRFIAAAARALGRGGRLLMVANRHLPYEQTLDAHFARSQPLAGESGYKVIEARI